jgi:quercetin dioxygenase-like cupin family protein
MLTTHDIALSIISLGFGASLLSACGRPVDSGRNVVKQDGPATPSAQHSSVIHANPIAAARVFPGKYAGNATAASFLKPTEQLAVSGALLTFDAGGRTAWHSHPAGQTLFVTSGTGWVQDWGRKKIEIKAGDVVWTPPGVKHWHGGTSASEMTHVAIQGAVGGQVVDWMEPVTDEQYTAP